MILDARMVLQLLLLLETLVHDALALSLFGLMLLLGESFRINFTLLRAHQPREDYMVFRVARDKDIVSYSIFL